MCDIPNPFGGPVYRFETVGSTMDEAERLTDEGAPHGTVVVADHQSRGQGRVTGRQWESEPGESLMFTLVLDSAVSGNPLKRPYPLMAALAVCGGIEETAAGARIKWPNDILINGRKCAGILCRTRKRLVHVGVGINCLQSAFSGSYRYRPTSLFLASGRSVSPIELLSPVLKSLYRQFSEPFRKDEFTRRMYGLGSRCGVYRGLPGRGEELEGTITGISDRGELLFRRESDSGIVSIASGEIARIDIH